MMWKSEADRIHRRNSTLRSLEAVGEMTAETLVCIARHPESSLHDDFEWDDKTAAKRWRESR